MSTAIDIQNCDSEPVSTIGNIQPHGMFYAANSSTLTISHLSENASAASDGQSLIGQPVAAVLGAEINEAAKKLLKASDARINLHSVIASRGGSAMNCILYRQKDLLLIECEPINGDNPELRPTGIQTTIDRIKSANSHIELLTVLTRTIRLLTGYDRVMAYHFDEDWNGEVIVDERRDSMPSWLNFRYPSSDIPAPARELFRQNWSRIIPTVNFIPNPILPNASPDSADALDLTHSILRAPSPIHVEYLHNMEVGGSFTLSLICNDKLWGMIACHHATQFFVNFESREACEMLAMATSARLTEWDAREKRDASQQLDLVKTWLKDGVAAGEDPTDILLEKSSALLELTGSSGVAVVRDDEILRLGLCPPLDVVKEMLDKVKAECQPLFATRNLTGTVEDAPAHEDYSGMMCVRVERKKEPEYLMWFRAEIVEEVIWGGDPHKVARATDGRIHPRKSFEAWKQIVRHTSTPWTSANIHVAMELANAIKASEKN